MNQPRILIIAGDLVEQEVEAIVNAANNELRLGGGVAGAIRRRGGPMIQDECDAHGPVAVGGAAVTGAGLLKAKHVIHAASMALGGRTTSESLSSSMNAVFQIAKELDVQTMAIPAVGTGIAGFPLDECARIMARCLRRALDAGWETEEVRFVLFGDDVKTVFEASFRRTYKEA